MCHVEENILVSCCFVFYPRRLCRWEGKSQPKEAEGNYQTPTAKKTVASKRAPLLKMWRCLHPQRDNCRREEPKQQTFKETFAKTREGEINSQWHLLKWDLSYLLASTGHTHLPGAQANDLVKFCQRSCREEDGCKDAEYQKLTVKSAYDTQQSPTLSQSLVWRGGRSEIK